MASANITDAERKLELSKRLTAFSATTLLDYIERTGHTVPDDRKEDKVYLKKIASELIMSGDYNISPFKLTHPEGISTSKQPEVAMKLFQEPLQTFDFEQFMKFTKSENERLEKIRTVERNEAKAEIKLAEKLRGEAEKLRAEEIKLAEKIRVDSEKIRFDEIKLAEKARFDEMKLAKKVRFDEMKLAERLRGEAEKLRTDEIKAEKIRQELAEKLRTDEIKAEKIRQELAEKIRQEARDDAEKI